jgi:hypothetical protein
MDPVMCGLRGAKEGYLDFHLSHVTCLCSFTNPFVPPCFRGMSSPVPDDWR